MAVPFLQAAFTIGELAPSLFGRADLARFHVAAGTMRNLFVRYQGGAGSRPGTAMAGYSKQTERLQLDPETPPPRLIPFQFNITQGLLLEFGHEYMRIFDNGAPVVEASVAIVNITNGPVASVQHGPTSGGQSAVANNGGVLYSYAPGDQVTLLGGTYTVPAVIEVDTTLFLGGQPDNAGVTGVYAPGDTIDLIGGTLLTPPIVNVVTTTVVSATITSGGSGGANGTGVVTGTTGVGTYFTAAVTIAGGAITSVDVITFGGSYSTNPASPAAEPVTGAGLAGATLNLVIGVLTISISSGGEFTSNPGSNILVQQTSSGAGLGVQFTPCLFGVNDCHFAVAGAYTVFPANPVAQASTTGSGYGVTFTVTTGPGVPFQDGDWVVLTDINGMTMLNNQVFVIQNVIPNFFDLWDVFGNPINTTTFPPYTGGGFISRVYTIPTPYQEADLRYLKFTQSADVMTICCVNVRTQTEYEPRELARNGATDWTLTPLQTGASVQPPTNITLLPTAGGATWYSYVVTAVSIDDGSESVGSPRVDLGSAVNIAATAGSILITWTAAAGAQTYNVYKATPAQNTGVPPGVDHGFVGSSYATSWLDSNAVPDFSQVPPVAKDPFARGAILNATPVAVGSGYTTAGVVITTSTGSGAVIYPLIDPSGGVSGFIVSNGGEGYADGDTIAVTGDGTGATAALTVGPSTGTYPAVPQYFQQRLFYANSLNNPITFWASQPGAFNNFDSRTPPLDTDAITGSPISVQVNGIQAMVNMPGGLVLLSGLGAFQLTGAGGSSFTPQPITPSSQTAQPQAFNGCHEWLPIIQINLDIIYGQALGSIVRNLTFNLVSNIYTGIDLTLNSSHLFTGFTLQDMTWCEEPYKLMWAVRSDGVLLSLTFEKAQEIAGWARHDTQGLYESVCSVIEPPVNALYLASWRSIDGQQSYMIERQNNRNWVTPEDQWCVDVGVALEQPEPQAVLTVSSAVGIGEISGFTGLVGGAGYGSDTYAVIVDDNGIGPGTGATAGLTIVGGAIVNINIITPGAGYTYPSIQFHDPAGSDGGSGASAVLTLNNRVSLNVNVGVFSLSSIGSVVRAGGGIMVITSLFGPNDAFAQMQWPISQVIPNTDNVPVPFLPGEWTMTAPVTQIQGLRHLSGTYATGIYDGKVIPPTLVDQYGQLELPEAATSVIAGLGFQVQLNSVYLDTSGGVTVQGQRKVLAQVSVRVEASRGFTVGSNQVDGSTLTPKKIAVRWTDMQEADVARTGLARAPYGSTIPALWTGDVNVPVMGGYNVPGQVAVQQDLPLQLNVLAFVPDVLPGDLPETRVPKRGRGGDQ